MAVADLILMSLQPCRILYNPLFFIFSPNDSPLTKKITSISFKNLLSFWKYSNFCNLFPLLSTFFRVKTKNESGITYVS